MRGRTTIVLLSALCVAAASMGLAIAAWVFPRVFGSLGLGPIPLSLDVYVVGFGIALLLAALSASIPASRVRRLTIVEALSGR